MAGELIERGRSLWKDRARSVQIQIRNRFRVAVDRRCHWKLESDYSQTIRRWIRKLWPDPSKTRASYRFYRKRVGKVVDGVDDSAIVRMMQAVAVPVIGSACNVFMHGLNHVKIYGAEKLHQALLERPKGKPLLTVSNHVAAIDDPFVIASLLPPNIMLDVHNLRWTLCATDRCFSNPVLSAFFRCVKVLPVSRGDGIYQKGMDMALSKLNRGGWVHIFPEGSRSRDGGKTVSSAKRGVGRLVMDADSIPVVIPFVHTGMQEIMPVGTKFPKVGKQVTVVVGDPIYLDDLLISKDTTLDDSRGILYDTVSSRIGHHLQDLKVQAEKLALEQQFELEQYHTNRGEHGYGIWQQVDWEAFGMENVMSSSSDGSQIVKQAPLNQPMEEQSLMPNSTQSTIRTGFSYEGGIMSRVRYYVNPSEFMGFAAKGLFMNSRLLDEGLGHFNIQEARPVRAWKQFMNGRLSDEGFNIQEAHPVRTWKEFMHERLPGEGRFNIQEAGPVRAWKQFMNERLSDDGHFKIQEAGPVRAWKQFMNERLSDEGHFKIQEAGPVRACKQFMNERFSDEGCFSIQEAGPVKAWKQFFEGSVYRLYNSM